MKLFPQNMIDIITNSSSELFVIKRSDYESLDFGNLSYFKGAMHLDGHFYGHSLNSLPNGGVHALHLRYAIDNFLEIIAEYAGPRLNEEVDTFKIFTEQSMSLSDVNKIIGTMPCVVVTTKWIEVNVMDNEVCEDGTVCATIDMPKDMYYSGEYRNVDDIIFNSIDDIRNEDGSLKTRYGFLIYALIELFKRDNPISDIARDEVLLNIVPNNFEEKIYDFHHYLIDNADFIITKAVEYENNIAPTERH